ncbi:hypothetical protein ACRALDRAFT_212087 [Sodiomyces alcalophilus JCM 7366]|uniref:uncharacterized protein n=1 Tax=Sodiomyces alcalophilus JCM 7366 TaxID=591952 RepID=UPI0039B5449C
MNNRHTNTAHVILNSGSRNSLSEIHLEGHPRMDQPGPTWTASRCRRLLRPLQARATALRKHSPGHVDGTSPLFTAWSTAEKSTKRTGEEPGQGGQRHKLRRTYSRRQQTSNDGQEMTTSAQDLDKRFSSSLATLSATPKQTFYQPTQRTPDRSASHNRGQQHGLRGKDSSPSPISRTDALEHALRSLRCAYQICTESRLQIYEGILRDLDAIIRATAMINTKSNPKALFSMCLRRVPTYIAKLEARDVSGLAQDGLRTPCRTSACIRIFDELEQFGNGQNGWEHLPTLTRANALHVMKEAAVEGLFDPSFTCIVIRYYNTAGCQRDAMDLFREVMSQRKPGHQDSNAHRRVSQLQRGVSTLVQHSELEGTAPRLFRSIAPLVLDKQLFMDRLSPEALGRLWTWVFESIQDPADSVGALDFASAAIASLSLSFPQNLSKPNVSGLVQGILDSAPVNIVGAIIALCFGGVMNSTHANMAISQRKVCYILRNAFNDVSRGGASRISRYILGLALFVATSTYPFHRDTEIQAKALKLSWQEDARANRLNNGAQFYSVTAALGCSIAQYSGRIASLAPSHYFSEFCDRLDALGVQALSSMRKDGAFWLAQRTHDLRDLAFAEALGTNRDKIILFYWVGR